jgi:hypothetical protein
LGEGRKGAKEERNTDVSAWSNYMKIAVSKFEIVEFFSSKVEAKYPLHNKNSKFLLRAIWNPLSSWMG